MRQSARGFIVMVRTDDGRGPITEWLVEDVFPKASTAWDCMARHRANGRIVKIVRR